MKRVSFFRELLGLSRRNTNRKALRASGPKLSELLERRQVLTGNVTASVSAGNLFVFGDEAGNSVELAQSGGNLVLRGLDNTTINGQAGEFLVRGGTSVLNGSLFAYLNGGNDTLSLGDGVTVNRDAFVYLGEGNDTFSMQGSNAQRGLIVDMSNGNDNISLLHAFVHRDATFTGLLGNKTVSISDSYLGNRFTLVTISGNDAVLIDNSHIDDDVYAYTGMGNDDVLVGDASFHETVVIDTSLGDDLVQVQNGSTFRDPVVVVLGDGNDTLTSDGNQFQDTTIIVGVTGNDTIDTSGSTFASGATIPDADQTAADDAAIDARINAAETGPIARGTALQDAIESMITLPELTVQSSADTIAENATTTLTGTVTRPTASFGEVVVTLSSSDTSEATVPAEVTIPAGQTSVTFAITPVNDTDADNKQSVTVTATAVGYKAGTKAVSITDDEVPALSLTFGATTLSEVEPGNSTTGTVTRPESYSADELVVTIANAADAQASAPATVTIPAGETSATFTLTADDDTEVDGAKVVAITVSATGFQSDTENVTVTDNESGSTLTLTLNPTSVSENTGSKASTATVSRNNNTGVDLEITIVSDTTSAATVPTTVTIPSGQASVTFEIAAVDDTLVDGTQTAKITVSATGFESDTESLTVTDDDGAAALTLTLNPASVVENAGASASTGTVTRNTPTTSDLVVTLSSSLTTAATVSATVTIPTGQSSVTFPIAAVDNDLVNDPQSVTITVSATGFTTDTETLTVTSEDVPDSSSALTLTLAANTLGEASGSRVTAGTVRRPNTDVSADLVVTVTSSDTTEVTVPTTVTIPAGELSKTFDITAVDDVFADGLKSAEITVSAADLESASKSVTVSDDDGAPTLSITVTPDRFSEDAGTKAASATVTRNTEPTADLVVDLSSTLPTGLNIPADITIPSGQTSVTFNIEPLDNTVAAGEQDVSIFADAEGHTGGTATISIVDNEAPDLTLTIDQTEVSEAGTNPVAMATLTRPANGDLTESLVISLSSDSLKLPITPTVTIPVGESSVTFAVTISNNNIADGNSTATLIATADGFNSDSAQVEITDDDGPASLTVNIADATVSEASSSKVVGTVTRNTDTTNALTVTITSSDESELFVIGSVVIGAGESSATFDLNPFDDDFSDGTQSVTITPVVNGFVGVSDSISVTDDEPAAALNLAINPESVTESTSTTAFLARVTRNTDPSVALDIDVSTTSSDGLTVPSKVTIPMNAAFVEFPIGTIDDEVFSGDRTADITVTAGDLTATKTITVNEDDSPILTLELPTATAGEGAGALQALATISRPAGSAADAVTVTLNSSDISEVTVPATVTIPAGELSTTFPVTILEDVVADGSQPVTITASATFFDSGTDTISVTDNDALLTLDTPTTGVDSVNDDLITRTAALSLQGQTAANATITLDSDSDGQFDDGTATADDNGRFTLNVTLVHDEDNLGANSLAVRSASTLGTDTQTLEIHYAVGSVVEFNSSQGDFAVELFDDDAPQTVANFKNYFARYTDSIIHRSPSGFVIQGGGFTVEDHEDSTHVHAIFTDAPVPNEFVESGHSNERGTLAMALPGGTNGINQGTSQWFINVDDNSGIDSGLYTVFGRVIGSGMDTVDLINAIPVTNLIAQTLNGALGQTPMLGNLEFQDLTGTVSIQEGLTTVTGVGTNFLTTLTETSSGVAGSTIRIGNETYKVNGIQSNTQLTLNRVAAETLTDVTAQRHANPDAAKYVVFSNIGEILNGGT